MRIPLVFLLFGLAGCTTQSNIPCPRFYDYWESTPGGGGIMGTPTDYYTELFSERGPKGAFYDVMDRDFYFAACGDVSALHRFLNSPNRLAEGAPGEGWDADMVILALKYGDTRLYAALQLEPQSVRDSVGATIEQQLKRQDLEAFIKTRTLYKFRRQPNRLAQALQPTRDNAARFALRSSPFHPRG